VLLKLSTQSCLEIRMQNEVTAYILITVPLQGWKSLSHTQNRVGAMNNMQLAMSVKSKRS